jgi:hypothetical protein
VVGAGIGGGCERGVEVVTGKRMCGAVEFVGWGWEGFSTESLGGIS